MSSSSSPPTSSSLPRHPARHTLRHRARTPFPSLSAATTSVSDPSSSDPRFSCLLATGLGSPFLTTSEPPDLPPALDFVDGDLSAVPRSFTVTRPSSPALSHIIDTFSIISSSEIPDVFPTYNYPYPYVPTGLSLLTRSHSNNVGPMLYSSPGFGDTFNNSPFDRVLPPNPLKSLFPRLWDALSLPRPQRFPSPGGKGKEKAGCVQSGLNFLDLPPLDGEEGELIDDEACFIDVRAVTGLDILSLLPLELALYILATFLDLPSVLACLAVSRKWHALASDNCVWRGLFVEEASNERKGWGINVQRVQEVIANSKTITWGNKLGLAMEQWNRKRISLRSVGVGMAHHVSPSMRRRSTAPSTSISRTLKAGSFIPQSLSLLKQGPGTMLPLAHAPLRLNWSALYRERYELDKRWLEGEPEVKRLEGHTDSVYCLEFDSTRIITGSRDKTIKVWSLATGRLLGTLRGHSKSVLCLKFDKDWEKATEEDDIYDGSRIQEQDLESRMTRARASARPGFMVSGSSDCSVCVWDLYAEYPGHDGDRQDGTGSVGGGEGQVRANVRRMLKGHSGGVLDLRIDKRWIVSCSKDTLIRVWDRRTLKLHRTLWGHEGPVNAVGLQSGSGLSSDMNAHSGRVVSASGDGKMMMWDIESGERLKTFEGHDRGLACIEFKGDLIVSGSNDCKIKVWSASTGECIRTLVGHDLLVRALSFEPKSGRLVSASYDRTVKVWDLKSGKLVREFRNGHTSHIFDVKFDVGRIVSTSHDKKVVVLDFTQGIDSSVFV